MRWEDVYIGGIMEHIEEAGIHSETQHARYRRSISPKMFLPIRHQTSELAFALNVVGLVNIQFAIREDKVYLLEVNPAAAGPFLSLRKPRVCRLLRWHRESWRRTIGKL